ncbi:MAG: GNAT family N-acetyltransferase [Pseudomonadota bacterium]
MTGIEADVSKRFSVREMRPADIPETFEVRFSTAENAVTAEYLEAQYGITPTTLERAMAAGVRGWVGIVSGRIVGYAMGAPKTGEVLVVAVRPEFEGRGIGDAVLSRVRDWLFDIGHGQIWLGSNPDPAIRATRFYRERGWRANGEAKGEDIVLTLRRRNASSTLTEG